MRAVLSGSRSVSAAATRSRSARHAALGPGSPRLYRGRAERSPVLCSTPAVPKVRIGLRENRRRNRRLHNQMRLNSLQSVPPGPPCWRRRPTRPRVPNTGNRTRVVPADGKTAFRRRFGPVDRALAVVMPGVAAKPQCTVLRISCRHGQWTGGEAGWQRTLACWARGPPKRHARRVAGGTKRPRGARRWRPIGGEPASLFAWGWTSPCDPAGGPVSTPHLHRNAGFRFFVYRAAAVMRRSDRAMIRPGRSRLVEPWYRRRSLRGSRSREGPWGRSMRRGVGVPFWFATLVLAIYPGRAFARGPMRRWRRNRRQRRGLCPTCAYNLTGSVSGVCPECGVGLQVAFEGDGRADSSPLEA